MGGQARPYGGGPERLDATVPQSCQILEVTTYTAEGWLPALNLPAQDKEASHLPQITVLVEFTHGLQKPSLVSKVQ